MKIHLSLILNFLILLLFSGFTYSQEKVILNSKLATNYRTDSINLDHLLVNLLKWHESDHNLDFEPIRMNPNDSIYTGINWQLHKKRMAQLEKTNFFTKGFLDNYQKIAIHLDKELKLNKSKYIIGELPPYDHPDEWCNCQDYPSNIWKRLKIMNLKINSNSATFKWTWGTNFFYVVKTRKENNIWKIAELEGFNIKSFSW